MSSRDGPGKQLARALRRRMTPTERVVWKRLRNYQTHYYFRRQHRLAGYVLDFYCHRARLCVELDGLVHDPIADQARDEALLEHGIVTLRFKNWEIAEDWQACLRRILFVCIDRDVENFRDSE